MKMRLVLAVCSVFGLTSVQPLFQQENQVVIKNVNDGNEIHENFQHLFNSIANRDTQSKGFYQGILNEEVTKERQAFDAKRVELRNAQIRNSYKKRNIYQRIGIHRNHVETKRETMIDNRSIFKPEVKIFDVGDMSPCNYLYIQMKECLPPLSYPANEETTEKKDELCIGIMKSEWMVFQRQLIAIEQHGDSLYNELRENYPEIYAQYSSEADRANPYRLVNITAYDDESLDYNSDEMESYEFQEYAISCLARSNRTGKIEQYFISQELDLEPCTKRIKNLMAVFFRIVFTFKEKRGIVPVAFTENRLDMYRLEPDK